MNVFDLPPRKKTRTDQPESKSNVLKSSSTITAQPPIISTKNTTRQTSLLQFTGLQKQQSKLECKLDCLYWIKKPVPDTRWQIMANPTTKGFGGEDMDPYPLYVDGKEWIGVPRFFGVDTYGKPVHDNRSLGAEMNPSLKFTWKLQNTPQKPQIDAVNSWINNHGEGVLCLPCGGGKTVIAVYLAIHMKRRTLILVQNGGLLIQWLDRIRMICPQAKIGIIQQKKLEIDGMDFVIGMIQTVRSSEADFSSFGLVIVDECHHIAAKTFSQSVMKTKPKYILGLSATPERKDGLTYVLHWLLGPMVYKTERKDITPQTIFQIEYPHGNQKVIAYKNGTKGIPSMVTRMTKDAKRNMLVNMCIKRLLNMPDINKILVISDRREHLEEMNDLYSKSNHSSGLYIGNMKKPALEESKTKKIIFASYSMAKEYLDIDGLNGMVLATPCIVDTEQVVGRLRENLSSSYGLKTMDDDDEYEEGLEYSLHSIGLSNVTSYVKNYLKKPISRTRVVYDIIDPFDLFDALAWKRFNVYKNLGYHSRRIKLEEFTK